MFLVATVFVLILTISFVSLLLLTRPSKVEKAIDSRLSQIHVSEAFDASDGTPSIFKQTKLSEVPVVDAILHRVPGTDRLQRLLTQADSPWTAGQVLLAPLVAAPAAYIISAMFLPLPGVPLGIAILAASLPILYLRARRERRLRRFERVLADAIDIIARSLRAGHAVSAALEIAGDQAPEPARSEFRTVCRQQNLGLPFRESLLTMVDRVPSADLQLVVTSMLVQKETGGNLIEILDRTCQVIRERVRLEGEVRIYTAQGRLTAWILGLLPICLYLILRMINPIYMKVMTTDPIGQKLLAASLAQVVLGFLVIRKVVKVKV